MDMYSLPEDCMYVMPTPPSGRSDTEGKYVKMPAPGSSVSCLNRVGEAPSVRNSSTRACDSESDANPTVSAATRCSLPSPKRRHDRIAEHIGAGVHRGEELVKVLLRDQ